MTLGRAVLFPAHYLMPVGYPVSAPGSCFGLNIPLSPAGLGSALLQYLCIVSLFDFLWPPAPHLCNVRRAAVETS